MLSLIRHFEDQVKTELVPAVESNPVGALFLECMPNLKAFAEKYNLTPEHVLSAVIDEFLFHNSVPLESLLMALTNRNAPAVNTEPLASVDNTVEGTSVK